MSITITLALAVFLSLVNFFAEMFSEKINNHHSKILSFSSGIFVAYIFLALLPEALRGKEIIGEGIFLYLLLGFVLFHLLEKFVYQHVKNKNELMKDLSEIHALGFTLDHFVVGMLLFFAVNIEDIFLGLLIIMPLFLHVISSSISLNHIHRHFNHNSAIITILSVSPILGAAFAFYLNQVKELYYIFFAISLGTILYVTIRDMSPNDGEKINYFILGLIVTIIIVAITKQIQTTALAALIA